MTHDLDRTETLIASLLCADSASERDHATGAVLRTANDSYEELHGGVRLDFEPLFPSKSYTTQLGEHVEGTSSDRLYTDDSRLLRGSVQDIIGARSEVAVLGETTDWLGFKKLHKAPKSVWVSSPGATLYEVHQRVVHPDGTSAYLKHIAAVSKAGRAIPCVVIGSRGAGGMAGEKVILAASIIEDAHRTGVLTAEVRDTASVVFPVPMGDHKKLFATREAPLTPAGKRKAILHWVREHIRGGVGSYAKRQRALAWG